MSVTKVEAGRDTTDLPFVLRLLDDESPEVRTAVIEKLISYGPDLEDYLEELPKPATKEQVETIRALLLDHRQSKFRATWHMWQALSEEARLEGALSMLSDYQDGRWGSGRLSFALDDLADRFRESSMDHDGVSLANFLFKQENLVGSTEDFYHPDNSNLVAVIKRKRGLPISLAIIYILVGQRLGIPVEGLNYPGYFLCRTPVFGRKVIVDCFNRGRLLEESDLGTLPQQELAPEVSLDGLVPDATEIVVRVLRNLVKAYQENGEPEMSEFMLELLGETGNPIGPEEEG